MSDFVWVLRHPTNRLTKTWKQDGTIEPYADPKRFTGKQHPVASLGDLSKLLTTIENDPKTCVIRGRYLGDEHSAKVEPDESAKGRVLRRKSVHEDVPHHWLMVDIDNYEPFDYDPMLEPVESINEFIVCCLPACFHGASFHWQLSSSAGHPSKPVGSLKAHVWFWLKTPYTSSQLRTWAKAINFKGDKALFDTIQVHYTATPVFEEGVINPITHRSGFAAGDFGEVVDLRIEQSILDTAPDVGSSVSRHQKVTAVQDADEIVELLNKKKMVKSKRGDGGLNIVCPRESEHTGPSTESSTIYYPAFTGGHHHGAFVCLHEHCQGVPKSLFLDALGYDDLGDVFEAIPDMPRRERAIPEARHLCTDQANAHRIMASMGKKIIVVGDRWYVWDGTHWHCSDGDALRVVMNLSKMVLKESDVWRAKKTKTSDEREKNMKIADALVNWSKKSEMSATINASMAIVKKTMTVDICDVNKHVYYFNAMNGTVDVRTMTIKPHDPDDMITWVSPLKFDPKAKRSKFERMVKQIFMEDDKPLSPISDCFKRWCGYCATGSTREQKFAVMFGKGSNGKSTLLDVVAEVLGPYAGTAAPNLLMGNDSNRHPTEIADLYGKRLVTAHESGDGGILREDFVKQNTGGDKLKARYMGKDFFEFSPTHKLQLLTNYKPTIKGQDHGIWRRVLLFPYDARFGTAEDVANGKATHVADMELPEKLREELEGILAWVLEGAHDWYLNGLNPPAELLSATKEYQNDQDRTLQFVKEMCELGYGEECYLTNGMHFGIYPAYALWCKTGGVFALSKVKFLEGLERVVPHFHVEEKVLIEGGGRKKVKLIRGVSCLEAYEM